MALRYYPQSKVKTNLQSNKGEFLLAGKPYTGKYYMTFDGRAFSGINPAIGENKELTRAISYKSNYLLNTELSNNFKNQLASQTNISSTNNIDSYILSNKDMPTSYFPIAIQSDYAKGYIIRYFTKRINMPGYVIEISPEEYADIKNGTVPYDVSFWQTQEIFWKLTGPLNQKRISQYDVRAGIIDTNKRLVETANKTFLGITDFIGGDYSKFAIPTE